MKNAKKERKSEFCDPKVESQRINTTLENIKLSGLKEIVTQLSLNMESTTKMNKRELINLLDPKIRLLDTRYHLVVDKQRLRTNLIKEFAQINGSKQQEICRRKLRTHDIADEFTETDEAFEEACDNCLYLDSSLVSEALLKRMHYHKVSIAELKPLRVKLKMSEKQKDISSKLVASILENKSLRWKNQKDTTTTAKNFNKSAKLDAEVFYRRCMKITVNLYDRKDENFLKYNLC